MLGSVSQSIAMPRGGASPFVGQVLLTDDGQTTATPAGSAFAFVEVLAKGGAVTAATTAASAGGAASDSIIPVEATKIFAATLLNSTLSTQTSSISYDGVLVVAADGPGQSASATQTGPSGKYPGGSATAASAPGRGGGRLAGAAVANTDIRITPGNGSGRQGGAGGQAGGGRPLGCVTFFRTYDAALAFANSLYNGAWVPS